MAFPPWVAMTLWISFTLIFLALAGLLAGILTYKFMMWKRYRDYYVMIFFEDEFGQKDVKFDQGGIFVDRKTNNKKFFLRTAKVGLDFKELCYSHGNNNKKVVMLFKKKDAEYQYIKPEFSKKSGKDTVEFSMGEEDLNWGLNSYEKSKTAFAWRNKLLQFAPWIGLVFVGFMFLILCIYVLKQFDVLKDLGMSLERTATILTQNSGVVVQ